MNERDTLRINENNHLEIGGADAVSLAKEYGTPLYVFDKSFIKKICNVYSETLKEEYGYGRVVYASKAFSCKEIYRIISETSLGIDVVSGGELYTARSVDFPSEKIYFHGNNKTEEEIDLALKEGVGTFVIDSFEEADLLQKKCAELGINQNVLIRINPGVEAHTHHFIQTANIDSKFGFSISNGQATEIIMHVKSKNNLILSGLHCHIGSQIFEKKSFLIAIDKMTDYYKTLKEQFNIEFDTLNLGGGFGIWYAEGDEKMTYNDYADYIKEICRHLLKSINQKGLKKPYLILEPGRSIVGEAGITLYDIGNIKTIPDIKTYLSVNGGMFENPRFALYQAKYTVVACEKMNEQNNVKYSISGKCCESGDIIAEDVYLPKMNKGDIIAVLSTGAYNYSMASNYNRNLVPPVVMVENGKSYYAVNPQSYKDLIRNDV